MIFILKQSKPLYKVRNIENLKQMIDENATLYKDKPAFKVKNNKKDYDIITHIMLKEYVDSLGTKLIHMGLKDKKIAIISENRYEWCISYLAVVNGTGIAVPLDRALPDEEIESLILRAKVDCIIFSEKYIPIMKKIQNSYDSIKYFICMDKIESSSFLHFSDLLDQGKELLNFGNKKFTDAHIDNTALSVIIFTSGTTSASKAVMLSHKNICVNITATSSIVKIKANDVALSFLPLHHTYECTLGFLTVLYNGASIVHCEGLKYIMQNLKESKASVMVCVPLLFENMHKKIFEQAKKTNKLKTIKKAMKVSDFFRKFLGINITKILFKSIYDSFGGRIRLFICGAAAINPQVAKDFNSFGVKFLQGYGLTETAPLLTGNTDRDIAFNSPGKAVPGVCIKINNPNENGIGEIIAKGPNVMLGYYENSEATNEVIKDGWFYTGDLGYESPDGNLIISGRKKNVIVLKNGKNVFPEELEALLDEDEIIKESMIWGEETKNGDTVIAAKIVPNLDRIKEKFGTLSELQIHEKIKEIVKNINHKIPSYKSIKDFRISAEELIKTTTQKVKRFEEIRKLKSEVHQ